MSYAFLADGMSADYAYKVDVEEFVRAFNARWPKSQLRSSEYSSYPIRWEVQIGDSFVIGGLHSDCVALSLEGDLAGASDIAIWYRSLIPKEHKLFFYTGARINNPIELDDQNTSQELIDAFNNANT